MAEIIKRGQTHPQGLSSLVSNALLSMQQQEPMRNGLQRVSKKALALRNNHRPSEVLIAFPPALQSTLPASCESLYQAYNQPEVPKLRTIAEAYGQNFCVTSFMKAHMVKVNEFSGAKNKLDDGQVVDLCEQILAEYGYLNLFEFIVFCGRLRSGKYEDFYGSVDPMRIMKSLEAFMKDRWNDIVREEKRIESERQEREYNERLKNSVTFEQWFVSCEDEEAIETSAQWCGQERWKELMAERAKAMAEKNRTFD